VTVVPRILIVAGSDSSGGAGIQADIKSVTMMGGHAMTAVTAVTVQDTTGVSSINPVPPEIVAAQVRAVLGDLGADMIKTGMLVDAATITALIEALGDSDVPIVVDPVMVAKGGAKLLADDAVALLSERLLPRALLITPNAPELGVLTGMTISDPNTARIAALRLSRRTGAMVLAKGGHLPGDSVVDWLVARDGRVAHWEEPRIDSRNTHGTGCTLASAIATGLAAGMEVWNAVDRARAYVRAAIEAAPGIGKGHGPLGHALGRPHFPTDR
jgi:hydroxymethylpyrimidine/phosphomethylpyrimidine kinase